MLAPWLAALAVAGCNALWGLDALRYHGSSAGGGAAATGPESLDAFCEDYAQMSCEAAQRCGCFEAGAFGACLAQAQGDCLEWLLPARAAGRIDYDRAQGGQCLAQLEAVYADCVVGWTEQAGACQDMLVGTVPENGACVAEEECAGELLCLDGKCLALPGDGLACHEQFGCAMDAFCGDDKICHTRRALGEQCPDGWDACEVGLYCEPASHTCRPLLGAGASCAGAEWACEPDLYCKSAGKTCAPYAAEGQSCADSEMCQPPWYCGDDKVCRARLPADAPCTTGDQCKSGSCVDGHCEPAAPGVCF